MSKVTTTYLQMLDPSELIECSRLVPQLEVRRAEIPCGELNRFLYTAVGADWSWTDRLPWTLEEWNAYAQTGGLETWIGSVKGTPAGYFELMRTPNPSGEAKTEVEIAYFGLLPAFIGQGIGGALLTAAIKRAWEMDASRVWVHTCTLDGPHALANYQARGMRIYKQETDPAE